MGGAPAAIARSTVGAALAWIAARLFGQSNHFNGEFMPANAPAVGAAQQERLAAAYQEMSRLCLESLERQHRLHADAVKAFCERQQDNVQALAGVANPGERVARYWAAAVPGPIDLWEISMRYGEIAADLQAQAVRVMTREIARVSGNGHLMADHGTAANSMRAPADAQRRAGRVE
jgi:hypothetical protein